MMVLWSVSYLYVTVFSKIRELNTQVASLLFCSAECVSVGGHPKSFDALPVVMFDVDVLVAFEVEIDETRWNNQQIYPMLLIALGIRSCSASRIMTLDEQHAQRAATRDIFQGRLKFEKTAMSIFKFTKPKN
jgi:hypothetical protein